MNKVYIIVTLLVMTCSARAVNPMMRTDSRIGVTDKVDISLSSPLTSSALSNDVVLYEKNSLPSTMSNILRTPDFGTSTLTKSGLDTYQAYIPYDDHAVALAEKGGNDDYKLLSTGVGSKSQQDNDQAFRLLP